MRRVIIRNTGSVLAFDGEQETSLYRETEGKKGSEQCPHTCVVQTRRKKKTTDQSKTKKTANKNDGGYNTTKEVVGRKAGGRVVSCRHGATNEHMLETGGNGVFFCKCFRSGRTGKRNPGR